MVDTEIRFLRSGSLAEQILHGELLDILAGGICIFLDDSLQPSDKILIEVRAAGKRCFNLTAEVIWIETADNSRERVGCELCVNLTLKQDRLLLQCAAPPAAT